MVEQDSNFEEVPVASEIKEGVKPTRLEKFAQTSTAAKLSGRVNRTAGFFKRKVGEMTEDLELQETGQNQELVGKLHSMVGTVRDLKERATAKAVSARTDGTKILRKHAAKLLDQANEFVQDVRDTFFKN